MKKTASALALIAAGTAALAHGGVTNKDVMARMMVMSSISDQMKVIGSMAKGETAFDADAVNAALIEIAAPIGSGAGDVPNPGDGPEIRGPAGDLGAVGQLHRTRARGRNRG